MNKRLTSNFTIQASEPPSATSGGTVCSMIHSLPRSYPIFFQILDLTDPFLFPGYHLRRVHERDVFYSRLEQDRAAQRA